MRKFTPPLFVFLLLSINVLFAEGPGSGKKVYINPGHGTYTVNDRPMPTISYPKPTYLTPGTTVADNTKLGFFESNTNRWKAEELQRKLVAAGCTVYMSHKDNVSPDLSTVAAAVQSSTADYFISIHSNAISEGSLANYLALFYTNHSDVSATSKAQSKKYATDAWPYAFEAMGENFEPRSAWSYEVPNIIADTYIVTHHSRPGFLVEGWFHTYQPARHRALNKDFCRMEGVRYYRAIAAKLWGGKETIGYVMGVVKSATKKMTKSTNLSATSWNYRDGSHDQYVPLNGSVVYLLDANGNHIRDDKGEYVQYKVDANYNGIFVFEDLQPGKYKIKATCAGHKSLIQDVTVVANETTYPVMLLSEGSDEVVALAHLDMYHNWNMNFNDIKGVIKRVLQWGDYIVVLSHEEATAAPHLYLINQRIISEQYPADRETMEKAGYKPIRELSLQLSTGLPITRDATNAGEYLSISDIAITEDGQLVACNYIRCQSDAKYQDANSNYKRGAVKIYKWQTLTSNPQLWVTATPDNVGGATLSGNFERGDVGYTMAVDGNAANCHITLSAVNGKAPNSNEDSQTELRYVHIDVVNNLIQQASCSWTKSSLSVDKQKEFLKIDDQNNNGFRLHNSLLGPKRWVIDAGNITAYEFIQTTNGQTNSPSGAIPAAHYGTAAMEVNYVNWQGHCLAVAPYYDDGTKPKGVKVLDISNGFDKAVKVDTKRDNVEVLDIHEAHPEIDNSIYAVSTAQNDGGAALHIFHFSEGSGTNGKLLVKYSTRPPEDNKSAYEDVNRGIYAYDLDLEHKDDENILYDLSFCVNDIPKGKEATLIVYMPDGKTVLYRETLSNVTGDVYNADKTITKGAINNIPQISTEELYKLYHEKGIEYGDELPWAIEVENYKVTEWKLLHEDTRLKADRVYNTVDNSPKSPHFGRIYVAIHESTGNTRNGIYVKDQQWNLLNTSPWRGSGTVGTTQAPMNYVGRISTDKNGTLYIPHYNYGNTSTVWRAEANKIQSGPYSKFFPNVDEYGTLLTTSGQYIGFRPPCVSIQETKDGITRMWLFNTHNAIATKGGKEMDLYDLCVNYYDIGTSSSPIASSWNKIPDRMYDIGINEVSHNPWYHGNVYATDEGYWVAIPRVNDMNELGAEALKFYAHGTDANNSSPLWTSVDNYNMQGATKAGFAISSDESILVMSVCTKDKPTEGKFLLYDIDWVGNKPTLTLRDTWVNGHKEFYSLSFDYAGNLVATGSDGLFIYGIPTKGENKKLTHATEPIVIYNPYKTKEEPLDKEIAIYAYDLRVDTVKKDLSEYCFSFRVNQNATDAKIVFFDPKVENPTMDDVIGELPLTHKPTIAGKTVIGGSKSYLTRDTPPSMDEMLGNNNTEACKKNQNVVWEGYNSYFISADELPLIPGNDSVMQHLSWGVWVKSKAVTKVTQLYSEEQSEYSTFSGKARTMKNYASATNAIDKDPESDYFGRTYVMEFVQKLHTNNGLFYYNPLWELNSQTRIQPKNESGAEWKWSKALRFDVGNKGLLYMSDNGSTTSSGGLFTLDPSNLAVKKQFTNASPSIMCAIAGTGENTALFTTAGTNKEIAMYRIGANGMREWTASDPTKKITHEGQYLYGPYSMAGSRRGMFVESQEKSGGTTDTYSRIYFYDLNGNSVKVNGANYYSDAYLDHNRVLTALVALSEDETKLVELIYVAWSPNAVFPSDAQIAGHLYFVEYDVTWSGNAPTLTHKGTHKIGNYDFFTEHRTDGQTEHLQLNFDYAGNLILSTGSVKNDSGDNGGFHVFSFPKADNSCMTPAKRSMQVKHVRVTPETNAPQRGVFAYDLRVTGKDGQDALEEVKGMKVIMPEEQHNTYTFTFEVNSEVKDSKAVLRIYDAEGKQPISVPVLDANGNPTYSSKLDGDGNIVLGADGKPVQEPVTKFVEFLIDNVTMNGGGTFTLPADALPGNHLDVFTWAVEVEDEDVKEWGILSAEDNSARVCGYNAINMNTESDAFAKIYTYYSGTDATQTGNWIYTPDLFDENDSQQNPASGNISWGTISNMASDPSGNIYIADRGINQGTENASGGAIVKGVPKAENMDQLMLNTLTGAYPVYGVDVYDKTLWAYVATNPTDGLPQATRKLVQYSLEDNQITELCDIIATNNDTEFRGGNVVGTDKGVFVSLHGKWGVEADGDWSYNEAHIINNERTGSIALQFYDNNGNAKFNSYGVLNNGSYTKTALSHIINGSEGGAFAITPDGKKLILQNATQQFLVFDLTWTADNVPMLDLAAVYTHGKEDIHQMNFDYGGNLIATGKGGMTVFAIPTGEANRHETPASVERRKIVKFDPYYDRIFVGGTSGRETLWSEPNNWDPNYLPEDQHSVLIQAVCEVDTRGATARFIDLQKGNARDKNLTEGSSKNYDHVMLTIKENMGLYVQETIRKVTGENYDGHIHGEMRDEAAQLHTTSDLIIKNTDLGQGSLVHFDTKGITPATVELYGRHESSSAHWQYVSLPFVEGIALTNFEGSWLARWDEPNMTWAYLGAYETVPTFRGHLLLQPTPKTYTLKGNIAASKSHTFTLSRKDADVDVEGEYGYNRGSNFLGNSWTAPLYIGNMSIKDFEKAHAEATIYIYNYAETHTDADTQKELPGNYVTVPVGFARLDNVTTHVINPLQGFFVMVKSDLGKDTVGNVGEVAFDYATLVNYPSKGEPTIPELNPYRIVRRNPNDAAQEAAEWWIVEPDNGYQTPLYDMSMRVADAEGHRCELQLYESAKFTYGFDNGYDGRKLNDEAAHPYLAAVSEKGDMAVLATPSFDGTFLNFKKGTGASASYTITFTYDGEDDYLLEDAIAGTATEIRTGKSYTFVPSADDKYRFRIVRSQRAPDITTDAPNVWASDDKLYLTNPAGLRTEVSVYSADGQLMERIVTYDSLMPLNVPATGVYVIEVRSEWGVRTIKHIM